MTEDANSAKLLGGLIALRSFEFTRGMSRVRVRRHVKVETFQGAGFAKIMREMLGK